MAVKIVREYRTLIIRPIRYRGLHRSKLDSGF
jgi:hypothetical protein